MGFGGLDPAENKLQFDLTESAQTVCLDVSSVVLLNVYLPYCSREQRNEQRSLGWISCPLDSLTLICSVARRYSSEPPL